jgi:hypothetical protein
VPGCIACDPVPPPARSLGRRASNKQEFVCLACGGRAYEPTFDAAAKRCPCAPNYGSAIDVSALLAASQDPALTQEQRKALAKQAGKLKLTFVGGLAGACTACPTTPDLLGQTYASPGGVGAVCAPVVAP